MSSIIEEFYKNSGTPSFLLSKKLSGFNMHPDIASEFEYWIIHKEFKNDGVEEYGYTAKNLASLSEYLHGEGAFVLLIELRENPEKALRRIKSGFKRK